VIIRLWRLLDRGDRRRVLLILPMLLITALIEIVGVAAVIPFLALLADPASVHTLPVVGTIFAASGVEDPVVLLRWTGVTLAFVLLIANGLVIATNWWLLRFSWSVNHRMSARLLRHYLSQPYAFTLTRNTAALANKVIVEVREMMENSIHAGLEVLTRSVVIVALVGFLVVLDPLLAVVVFTSLGAVYGIIHLLSRRYLLRIGEEAVSVGAARLKAVNEALGAFKDLKLSGREMSAFDRYDGLARRYGEVQAGLRAMSRLPRYALEGVAVGGMVLTASVMAGRTGAFVNVLPLLGAYAFAGLRLMPLMHQLFDAVSRSRFGIGALQAVEADFLEVEDGDGDLESRQVPPPFERSIALRDVSFSYPNEATPVLCGVDLEVPRRTTIALVGRTGSGKTTLIDVLLGLLTPDGGTVEVDGVPVTRERRRGYRRLFGYVPQSVYLLDDTVRRNVALGLPDDAIDMVAVRRACELAQIHDFVTNELANGYETDVGERGVRLSGGQRQRIGIARALYHRPQVLVFDEATSALDVHTERQLYEALEAIARSHTVITIAHRLETVAKADIVAVLDQGRIVDQGPPKVVLERYRHADGGYVAFTNPLSHS
jgi:ATP-binding cassette, subfamily B, bacterial PglK